MRQSQLLTQTQKNAPRDEPSRNAELLIRAGYIHKEMAGVYAYLPLGLRVLRHIESIIREEMNSIGGQELLMTTLQDSEIWEASGRWDDEVVDMWFKTALKNGTELGIANTHEEPLAEALVPHIQSYKDLPRYAYQFQNKFRNELRAKSGIMRGREFMMKDLYSFSRDEEEFRTFYEECARAYQRIFERVGIGSSTYRTFADGGSFSKFSDEFQTVCEAGEDTIYIDESSNKAINKEVFNDEVLQNLGISRDSVTERRAIEVGNIFPLGTKYSEAANLFYTDKEGNQKPIVMGSYGIGLGRIMGTVVELLSDERGIVWPYAIAPYKVHLLLLGLNEETRKKADALYEQLRGENVDVLYDDRDNQAGEKFAESDLLGIPWRLVIGSKTPEASVEIKRRSEEEEHVVPVEQVIDTVTQS